MTIFRTITLATAVAVCLAAEATAFWPRIGTPLSQNNFYSAPACKVDFSFLARQHQELTCRLDQQENIVESVPFSILDYEAYIKNKRFQYAPKNHTSICSVYPGGSLEAEKKGACDEFAFNAASQLVDAPDLADLLLVEYVGRHAQTAVGCSGMASDLSSHAIVAYQTNEKRWRSLSNGSDENISAASLGELVEKSARNHLFRNVTVVKAIPRAMLQASSYREQLLDSSKLQAVDDVYQKLSSQYLIYSGEMLLDWLLFR